jgi:hypothetical protein
MDKEEDGKVSNVSTVTGKGEERRDVSIGTWSRKRMGK